MEKGKSPTSSTEPLPTPAEVTQPIQPHDPENILDQVFIPLPDSSDDYILGPCFKSEFSLDMAPLYPLVEGEKLLLHSSAPEWGKAKTIRCWPTVNKAWADWVDRVERSKGEIWKAVGIYEAIQLSKIEIPVDKNLIFAALCFWSISNNSFHFNFGMMSPTILDIAALTGLRPHGEELSALLENPGYIYSFPKKENGKYDLAYGKFIDVSMGVTGVTDHEHISFLIMWLNKFLFCNASFKITKEYTQLAISLALGRKFALAPFVLSHLYRGCRDIILHKFGNAGGPFWILQLWLQSYFPEHRPLTPDIADASSYGLPLALGKLRERSFEECFHFFYSCLSRTAIQFTPFSLGTYGPEWFRWSLDPSDPKFEREEVKEIWASYLIARDLHFNLVVDKSFNCKCGVEQYSPNQVARQFGFTQTIPLPPYWSANSDLIGRVTFNSAELIQEIHSRFHKLKEKFSLVSFRRNPRTTKNFISWWFAYIESTRNECVEDVLKRLYTTIDPSQSPAKPAIAASESVTSHVVPETIGERAFYKQKMTQKAVVVLAQPLINLNDREEQESSLYRKILLKKAENCSNDKNNKAPNRPKAILSDLKEKTGKKRQGSQASALKIKPKKQMKVPVASPEVLMNSLNGPINQKEVDHINLGSSSTSFSSSSTDEETTPRLASPELVKSGAKISLNSEMTEEPIGLDNMEAFFARVANQLKRAQSLTSTTSQSSPIEIESVIATESPLSAKELAKAKEDVERILEMSFEDVLLLQKQPVLKAALHAYSTDPDLCVERVVALEKLKSTLPSLSSTFHRAKKDQAEYDKKAAEKASLTNELADGQARFSDLKDSQEKLEGTMVSIRDQIKELKASLKEAKEKKNAIQQQQLTLAKTCFSASVALVEMEAEFPAVEEKKELADWDMARVEASWADLKAKILDNIE